MKKYLFLIFLLITSQACKKKSHESFSEFPSEVNLTHQLIEVKGMADPSRVILLQDVIIVFDDKTDPFFHVLSKTDYTNVGSFIRRGRGPSEEMRIQGIMKLSGNQFFYKTLSHIKIIDYSADPSEFTIRQSIPVFVNDLVSPANSAACPKESFPFS